MNGKIQITRESPSYLEFLWNSKERARYNKNWPSALSLGCQRYFFKKVRIEN